MLALKIRDKNIWTIYQAILVLGIAYGTSISVLALHMDAAGLPKEKMGLLATAFALGIIVFSVPAGWLARRIGARATMILALVGYAICVTTFPFPRTIAPLAVVRFVDGACSAGLWVAAETALLARADKHQRAFVMSLYAISLALGYVLGPLLSTVIVPLWGTRGSFFAAGALACVAAAIVFLRLDAGAGPHASAAPAEEEEHEGESPTPRASNALVFWRTKMSCVATFSYGYFQSSVVLFLPLFLVEAKGVPKERTILVTACFAAGMLVMSPVVSRFGDRHGHLRVMRVLGGVGGVMVGSFVLLSSFPLMLGAVFVAGGTLAAISPVSLALQGVVTPREDLERANGFYNSAYAAGMLVGPPVSGWLFVQNGGAAMLLHLAGMWAVFVVLTFVFAGDDPRSRRAAVPAPAPAPESALS